MARYTINLNPEEQPAQELSAPESKPQGRYTLNMEEPEEGFLKSGIRTGLQIAKAIPVAVPAVVLHQIFNPSATAAKSESLDNVEQAWIEGWINQDQYEKAVKEIQQAPVEEASPTLSNLYKAIEAKTGIPTEAKTPLQKNIEFGSEVAGMSSGALPVRAFTGVTAGGVKEMLEDLGLPSWLTEPTVMATALWANKKATTPKIRNTAPPPPPREAYRINPYETPPGGVASHKGLVPVETPPTPMGEHELGTKIKEAIPTLHPPSTETRELKAERPVKEVNYGLPPDIAVPTVEPLPTKKEPGELKVEEHKPLDLYNSIGNAIIPREPISEAKAGEYLVNTLPDISSRVLERKDELYKAAQQISTNQEIVASDLVKYLIKKSDELTKGGEALLSTPQKKLLSNINEMLSELTVPIEGMPDPNGLRGVPTDVLYEWMKNLSNQVDFDFQDSHPTGIFKPVITKIGEQLESAAKNRSGTSFNDKEYQAIRYANWFYKNKWAEPFLNTKVIPYRDRSRNTNAVKLWNEATKDVDTFRALQNILNAENLPEGRSMAKLAKRGLVQNMFVDFIKNPEKIQSDPIEYDKKLREIKPLLTPEEFDQIKNKLDSASQAQIEREQAVEKHKQEEKKSKETFAKELVAHKEKTAEKNLQYKANVSKRKEVVSVIKKAESEENKRLKAQREAITKQKKEFLEERAKRWKISNARELKIQEMTPKEVTTHASTVSGLRDIGYVLSKQPRGSEIFDIVREAKLAETLYNGKESATPEQIMDVLKDVDKREFISEIIGDDNTRLLLQRTKNLIKLTDLTKKRQDILKKELKVPVRWRDRVNTWGKATEQITHVILHPPTFIKGVLKDFFKKEMSNAEAIKYNREINEALADIIDQIDAPPKEQDLISY